MVQTQSHLKRLPASVLVTPRHTKSRCLNRLLVSGSGGRWSKNEYECPSWSFFDDSTQEDDASEDNKEKDVFSSLTFGKITGHLC